MCNIHHFVHVEPSKVQPQLLLYHMLGTTCVANYFCNNKVITVTLIALHIILYTVHTYTYCIHTAVVYHSGQH